jgi:site-specific DNA recombinase
MASLTAETKQKTLRAWGYVRCSTDDQARSDFSTLDAQREAIEHYAERRSRDCVEWKIVQVLCDEGLSGKDSKRPGLQTLMRAVDNGEVDVVIVYRLDRISRSSADFVQMWERFQSANVNFVATDQDFDTTTPMGRAMLMIAMVFAQLERETIVEKIQHKMHASVARGLFMGGGLPFGVMLDADRSRVAHPEYVPIIREAYRIADQR